MVLNQREITVIRNAIINVVNELESELETRTGYDKEEIMDFCERIGVNNKLLKTNDFLISSQVLNEICNGYEVKHFESEIGENKDFAICLLQKMNDHIESLT